MQNFVAQEYYEPLKLAFVKAARVENAIQMKKYMRNQFEFLGIKTPVRKELCKTFFQQYGFPNKENLSAVLLALWQENEREYQYAALDLLDMQKKNIDKPFILVLEQLIIQKSWWDTVDLLASHAVANYFKQYPEMTKTITEKFIESENMWLQRTCLIFQLLYKKQTDEKLLFDYIRICIESQEFFIQKAIGWALRQYARTNPTSVLQFVENHTLKPLSKREALKHL
jgi:3-methyladenine DNA glycosylase AlkD